MNSFDIKNNLEMGTRTILDSCNRTVGTVDSFGTIRNQFGHSTGNRVEGCLIKDLSGHVVGSTMNTFTMPKVECPKW